MLDGALSQLGVVSLTFHDLSKIILRKYIMLEITLFLLWISSWNSVRVPKAWKAEILIRSTISAIHKFRMNILENSRNVSETTHMSVCHQIQTTLPKALYIHCNIPLSGMIWIANIWCYFTGGTGCCRYDKLRCHRWCQHWHYDDSGYL